MLIQQNLVWPEALWVEMRCAGMFTNILQYVVSGLTDKDLLIRLSGQQRRFWRTRLPCSDESKEASEPLEMSCVWVREQNSRQTQRSENSLVPSDPDELTWNGAFPPLLGSGALEPKKESMLQWRCEKQRIPLFLWWVKRDFMFLCLFFVPSKKSNIPNMLQSFYSSSA